MLRADERAEATLSDIAYEKIRLAILLGTLRPNQRLVEAELAETLEMSRTPIREALRLVEFDGLVDRRGHGVYVHEPTLDEIRELYEVRAILESGAAMIAARDPDPELLGELTRIVDESSAASLQERSEYVRLNNEFHQTVMKLSGNGRLEVVYRHSTYFCFNHSLENAYDSTDIQLALQQHQEILNAVRDGEPAEASRLAWDHVISARDVALAKLMLRGAV